MNDRLDRGARALPGLAALVAATALAAGTAMGQSAYDDWELTEFETGVSISILANDDPAPNDWAFPLCVELVTAPAHGNVREGRR